VICAAAVAFFEHLVDEEPIRLGTVVLPQVMLLADVLSAVSSPLLSGLCLSSPAMQPAAAGGRSPRVRLGRSGPLYKARARRCPGVPIPGKIERNHEPEAN
jgi:hypothetical protein